MDVIFRAHPVHGERTFNTTLTESLQQPSNFIEKRFYDHCSCANTLYQAWNQQDKSNLTKFLIN